MNQEIHIKKQWFIKSKEGKIEDFYTINDKELSSGSFGKVYQAKSKFNNPPRAVKIIQKRMIENKDRFMEEIDILRTLDHPNIIKLYETFEDARHIYLIMELCTGGELFDQITALGHFKEKDAQQAFIQIMHAINYCHKKGIAHRDLKPENFLYYDNKPGSQLKVIDFGLSRVFRQQGQQQKQIMRSKTGTVYYLSPEVLDGKYDELCDIWSAGVILYILLTGIPPFNGPSDGEIVKQIRTGNIRMDIPELQVVSDDVKDLIQKMIAKHSQRLNAEQVLQHPWMQQIDKFDSSLNLDPLKQFISMSKLKKVVLAQIASQVNENEIGELRNLFKSLDKDGNGQLSFEEFKNGFKETKSDLLKYFEAIDTDASGSIDYNEFIAAMMQRNLYLKQDKLLQAFQLFDVNNDGKISSQELKKILGGKFMSKLENEYYCKIDEKFWQQLIKEADQDQDGNIDYMEFVEMMDQE